MQSIRLEQNAVAVAHPSDGAWTGVTLNGTVDGKTTTTTTSVHGDRPSRAARS